MQIVGEWLECEDGVTRPAVRVHVQHASAPAVTAWCLIDSGADRTVLSAALLYRVGAPHDPPSSTITLVGVGGAVPFVLVGVTLKLSRDDRVPVLIHGEFAAFTDPAATDLSILGRDVLDNFDVILSRRRDEVLLLAPNHRYAVARD